MEKEQGTKQTVCIVADETNSIKLVLWEEAIDKVNAGKCYHIENCNIRIFDDSISF